MNEITIRGCFTAIVTPFNAEGKFDEGAMRNLVDWQIGQGIDGLVVCGTTGESSTLNSDETRLVINTVIEQTDGRTPVICGTGTNNTTDAVQRTMEAEAWGANAILSVVPYYNKPTQKGLFAHFQAVADSTSLPVILYNVPGRSGVNMSAETTVLLAQIDNIVAVKEASGNLVQIMEILRDRPDGFSVLSGDDSLTLPMLGAGADGVISVVSNQIPAEYAELVHAGLAGNFERARELQNRFLHLMALNFIESNPVPVKAALAMMGRIDEAPRLPLVPMQPATRTLLSQELEALELLP